MQALTQHLNRFAEVFYNGKDKTKNMIAIVAIMAGLMILLSSMSLSFGRNVHFLTFDFIAAAAALVYYYLFMPKLAVPTTITLLLFTTICHLIAWMFGGLSWGVNILLFIVLCGVGLALLWQGNLIKKDSWIQHFYQLLVAPLFLTKLVLCCTHLEGMFGIKDEGHDEDTHGSSPGDHYNHTDKKQD